MRILYYTHSWFPIVSGVTLRYKQFIDYLKTNNEIVLVTPYDSPEYPGIITYRIEGIEIPEIYIDQHDKRDIRVANFMNLTLISNIISICIKHKIDIIHMTCPDGFQLILKSVSNILNIPLVFMFHTNLNSYVDNLTKAIPRFVFILPQYIMNKITNPELIIVPSNEHKQNLINDGLLSRNDNIDILPIYANTKLFYPSEPIHQCEWSIDKTKLLYVGRVELEKNIGEIVEIMDDSMSLCIIGKGNDIKRLREIAIDKNLDVKFLGLVENDKLRYWYSSADIIVMPSKTETLGFTTLEAIACETIVIARNEGGTKDIIQHEYNGLLYNTSAELSTAIHRIISDTLLRKQIINNCRIYTEAHSMEKSMQWLYNEYRKLIRE
jgi:1,2-diacylglycerol 3-alpha-glucosyltransferase